MERHEVIPGHARDGLNRALPRAGMIGTIDQLGELPPGDGLRAVLPAPDAFDRLQLGQLDPIRIERRPPQQVGVDLEPALEILFQHIQRGGARLFADPDRDRGRQPFEFFVYVRRGHALGPAGAHDHAGQPGQADLVGRIEPTAGPHNGLHRDQRQFMIFQQVHHHAVVQDQPLRLGGIELHRRKAHAPGIGQRHIGGHGKRDLPNRRRTEEHDQSRFPEHPSSDVVWHRDLSPSPRASRPLPWLRHGLTSPAAFTATFRSAGTFTSVATVRLDFFTYWVTTR